MKKTLEVYILFYLPLKTILHIRRGQVAHRAENVMLGTRVSFASCPGALVVPSGRLGLSLHIPALKVKVSFVIFREPPFH